MVDEAIPERPLALRARLVRFARNDERAPRDRHGALCVRLAMTAIAIAAVPAQAQTWPTKPVRLVVGFPAGGPTDIVSRTLAPKLTEGFGQTVIVDNRAGAGGVIATEQVAKSPADGHTLLMGTIGGIAVAMSLIPNRGYDTLRDFVPITQAVTVTNLLVVHPTVPA